jgi:membrane AbrB-like protein
MTLPVSFSQLPAWGRWGLLVLVSLGMVGGLMQIHFPAALLLGCLFAGMVVGVSGAQVTVPKTPYLAAQALIGCLIAQAFYGDTLASFSHQWPLLLGFACLTLGVSSLLGWGLGHFRLLPGTTGIWGSTPGAAAAMVVMAENHGSDPQLVAFMQYLRVLCVTIAASLIAYFWLGAMGYTPPAKVWFPSLDPWGFGATLMLVVSGVVSHRLRVPSGALLVPMVAGAALQIFSGIHLQLPEWLMAVCYAALGWHIGLGFTPSVFRQAYRALPQMLMSIGILMVFCLGLAGALVLFLHMDPLTAYLATSPGGLDSAAIIAASSQVDKPFVMALQTARLLMVILVGPSLARWVAGHQTEPVLEEGQNIT